MQSMPTKAEKLKQRLARVNPAILEHFFLYYPEAQADCCGKRLLRRARNPVILQALTALVGTGRF